MTLSIPTVAMTCGARRATTRPYIIHGCPRECVLTCLQWDEGYAELDDAERRDVTHYEDWDGPTQEAPAEHKRR